MDVNSNRRRRDVAIAVIRDFQPVRIERELLAKAFDIAGAVACDPDERSENPGIASQTASDRSPHGICEASAETQFVPLQHNLLEAVA